MPLPQKRFLVLSDTHDDAFPDLHDIPKVDVVLHCGDLTMIGGLRNYQQAIEKIGSIDAELKLVIPGNHDVSLDSSWWANNADDDDDLDEPAKAMELFKKEQANGLHLLDEGVHEFTLADGATFKIYCSPYTPEFNGYAFAYGPGEDRFNQGLNPIPEGVDIVMTHGPLSLPDGTHRFLLDQNGKGEHCGCPKLFRAVQRSRPKLHCFGHIHEGYGAQSATWLEDDFCLSEMLSMKDAKALRGHTLMLNAAIMTHGSQPNNNPWVVDVELQ
ncbi:Metallo-dependent phosphatase-like protein [Xylariaceae sp. FL0804]|nr:Metallo-dependent phosphatase-like protein [Xylariaceae sp. FL0804]